MSKTRARQVWPVGGKKSRGRTPPPPHTAAAARAVRVSLAVDKHARTQNHTRARAE
jgi:hypothetical protein